MENQSKKLEELIAENKYLREKLGLLNTDQTEGSSLLNNTFAQSDQLCDCRPDLTRYALGLANMPGKEFYPFIVSRIADIFGAKLALISLYNEKLGELQVKYSSLSKSENTYISQLIGKKITNLRIKISEEQYNFICSEPHHFASGINELSFGSIPQSIGKIAESALDLGWFVGLGLTYQKKLLGTIIIIGPKNQTPPDNENLGYFCSITSSAVGRKIAEEALVESEARFRQLFDEAPVGYLSLDADGYLIDVNKAWLNMTGYKLSEVIGKRIDDFLSPSSQTDFPKKFMTFKEHGKTHCDLELLHKDGRIIIVEFDGKIGYDVNGNFNQTHCILKDITAHWQAEQQAHEREEMFQAIANHTANWESWFDNNGKIIWTNPAAFRFTGYTPEEIISMPDYVSAFVIESDRSRTAEILKEALQGKDSSSVEFTCIRKDQSQFRISISWSHIFDKNGKALGIRTSGQDITSHRKAEEAVSQSETLYKQMIDNAPFGMHFYELSENGRLIFTSANQAANKILNLDHQQFVGLEISEAFPSLKDTGVIEHYTEAAINNTTWLTDQIIYVDNKISGAFEVKAFQTMPGKMVAIFTDITKRKQAEEELLESRQLFETLTRVSPVGIFRTNAQGGTTFVNPKWIALTGLEFKDAMDSKYLDAVHPEDREERKNEWLSAVKIGKSVVSEYRIQRADGSIVWVQGHAVPEIADNKIKGYIGTITDITDLKQAEEELVKAKEKAEASNRLKATFMGNISHEIRTPLNGIIGFAELITSGNNTIDENKECIEFLNHSIKRLTKIIDNIMDVSVMMSGNTTLKREPVDIENILKSIFRDHELNAARKNLNFKLTVNGSSKGKAIISDSAMITRIINELVDNSIKFTQHGSVSISAQMSGDILSISVTDSGVGVSKEFLPYIFEPFVQEDVYSARLNNSSGLGLSIAYEAVNLLGGSITAESEPGSGTRITVTLPVIESSVKTEISNPVPRPEPANDKPVIMIVEDEEINMTYLKRLLNSNGHQLLLASNGPEAIAFIEQRNKVDIILMDMKMPGMDGFEATRRIKALVPEVKIAAVTAYASNADREACFDAGCDDYIAKPFQKNDLFELLKRLY